MYLKLSRTMCAVIVARYVHYIPAPVEIFRSYSPKTFQFHMLLMMSFVSLIFILFNTRCRCDSIENNNPVYLGRLSNCRLKLKAIAVILLMGRMFINMIWCTWILHEINPHQGVPNGQINSFRFPWCSTKCPQVQVSKAI